MWATVGAVKVKLVEILLTVIEIGVEVAKEPVESWTVT
jgi:hypothetical protein